MPRPYRKREPGAPPDPEGAGGASLPAAPAVAGPGLPGPGFRGWDEAQEARLERPASAQINPEGLVAEARVVYLGAARRKTVVRPGGLQEMRRADDEPFYIPAPREYEGNLSYDFARFDSRGRPNLLRQTKDGHPFAICRHIGHLAWFYQQVDGEDQGPVFELRAPAAVLQRVKTYIESTQRNVATNREHPINILSAMEREGANVWSERGGEVGVPVA